MKRLFGRASALATALFMAAGAYAGEITAYTSLEEDDVRVYLDEFKKSGR